ncbi:MAG: ligase-associated DNA damage response DEXH box helicase [Phycisphaerales bacterium]
MSAGRGRAIVEAWFASRERAPFGFQRAAWDAYAGGRSGLVHAPTGMGKTLAVWLGPVLEWLDEHPGFEPVEGLSVGGREDGEPVRVLWVTPLRALANDTAESLREPIHALGMPWTIEQRTGDTAQSLKKKQKERLPTALVTTPESLALLLSYPESRERLATLRCVVVDEWHELMSSKRGVMAELCLARLRSWNPGLRTWGLSATLGNLDEALRALAGVGGGGDGTEGGDTGGAPPLLIEGEHPKAIAIRTIVPGDLERFPWAGHLGLRLLPELIGAIERARTTLLFCNTRSQVELWFRAINQARMDWIGDVGLHHGSIDRALREEMEDRLRAGTIRCVVCTSSLDLGVDFSPVDQVIQIGSPKGIARLMQRAGRSGHRPGALSAVVCVPTNAFELVEFAAARDAVEVRDVESRPAITKPLDLLSQHIVTMALAGGFVEHELLAEVRSTNAFRELSDEEWRWTLEFAARGGRALAAYPNFQRLGEQDGRWLPRSSAVGREHRMRIGTITSDSSVRVAYTSGQTLGHVEESFVANLRAGDRFVFAGRVLELVRFREMTAQVKRSNRKSGIVPRWGGSKTPLSTMLARAVRERVDAARRGVFEGEEMERARAMFEVQGDWSVVPGPDELLMEETGTRDGWHTFLFPFEGRLVHEGLGAVIAHRLAAGAERSMSVTVNDYGLEIMTAGPMELDDDEWREAMRVEGLVDDLLVALNSNELARRRFRDIARIAGLITQGFPGERRSNRHLQASSELFFDVFLDFEPDNLLLDQARREVLAEQLELERLRSALERIGTMRLVRVRSDRLTPLAFPLWAERLRTQHVSSESWASRIEKMAMALEGAAQEDGLA